MLQALIALPLLAAVVVYVLPSKTWRPRLLAAVSVIHLALTLALLRNREDATGSGWLALDPAGRLILLLISVLFLVCSFYAVGYLAYRTERANRRFCAALLGLLGMMSLVAAAQHLGLMWVALEATTLLTAPLIYFNRTARSIEATWKYLLVCSVGIALALLGTFFLAMAENLQGRAANSLYLPA